MQLPTLLKPIRKKWFQTSVMSTLGTKLTMKQHMPIIFNIMITKRARQGTLYTPIWGSFINQFLLLFL
ncbi:hypothetical protein QL285_012725 [Trifolium repens]|nr:hypothetical protein QL285_012725 [Trifolium repens]